MATVSDLTSRLHPTLAEVAAVTGIPPHCFEEWIKAGFAIAVPTADNEPPRLNIINVFRFLMSASAQGHQIQPTRVLLADLTYAANCQVRVSLREEAVTEFAAIYADDDGTGLDPVVIVKVDDELLLVDGWHRDAAARRAKFDSIPAFIIPGKREWALFAAQRLNNWMGVPLSSQDRRRALELFAEQNPWIIEPLVSATISLRILSAATGFSKSALGAYAKELRTKISALDCPNPDSKTAGAPSREDEAKVPPPDAPPPTTPLREDAEAQALWEMLRSSIADLPKELGEARKNHRKVLTLIAGSSLRLLGIHLGYDGFASLQDLRRILRDHDAFRALLSKTEKDDDGAGQ